MWVHVICSSVNTQQRYHCCFFIKVVFLAFWDADDSCFPLYFISKFPWQLLFYFKTLFHHLLLSRGIMHLICKLTNSIFSCWWWLFSSFLFYLPSFCSIISVCCSSFLLSWVLLVVHFIMVSLNSSVKSLSKWLYSWLTLVGSSEYHLGSLSWWGSEVLSHCDLCNLKVYSVWLSDRKKRVSMKQTCVALLFSGH